jgi:hypothetical protein
LNWFEALLGSRRYEVELPCLSVFLPIFASFPSSNRSPTEFEARLARIFGDIFVPAKTFWREMDWRTTIWRETHFRRSAREAMQCRTKGGRDGGDNDDDEHELMCGWGVVVVRMLPID